MPVLNHLGVNYYISDQVIKNYARIFTDDDWNYTTAYYFKKGKKKTEVKPEQQKADYVVSKLSKYEKDTFYKLTNESRNSTLFDYFIKLKPKPPPTICIGTGEHKKVLKDKLKELKEEEKKILIRFE